MKFHVDILSHIAIMHGRDVVDCLVGPDEVNKGDFEIAPLGKDADGVDIWPTPGPHWKPLDAEAEKLMKRKGVVFTGEVPDVVEDLAVKLEQAKEQRQREERNDDLRAMGREIGSAIAEKLSQGMRGAKAA
jgi:hypothetical protein